MTTLGEYWQWKKAAEQEARLAYNKDLAKTLKAHAEKLAKQPKEPLRRKRYEKASV